MGIIPHANSKLTQQNGMQQITDTLLMVRPAQFGFNVQTADNNAFQTNDTSLTPAEISQRAIEEFDQFVATLRAVGVDVWVVADTPLPVKHDAVFPNNWFSTHADGRLVTYPMYADMRRLERREDILGPLVEKYGYTERLHLEVHEAAGRFLEGTGSLIFDRDHRIVYACKSIRTDEGLLLDFAASIGYQAVAFDAVDRHGQPIYHTNVMMALGTTFCVICLETIADADERQRVVATLTGTGKAIIDLSLAQMESFAGNMLQVKNKDGDTFLVMSEQAFRALTSAQISELEGHTQLLHSPIPTIEMYGGGSARCMMAEVFAVAG